MHPQDRQLLNQIKENHEALNEGELAYQAGARSGYFEPEVADRADLLAWQIEGDIKRLTGLMFAARKMGCHPTAEAIGEDLDDLMEERDGR